MDDFCAARPGKIPALPWPNLQPPYTLAFGRNSFGQMDPWLLERVEVIKGPASVLYTRYSPEHLRAAADALEFD